MHIYIYKYTHIYIYKYTHIYIYTNNYSYNYPQQSASFPPPADPLQQPGRLWSWASRWTHADALRKDLRHRRSTRGSGAARVFSGGARRFGATGTIFFSVSDITTSPIPHYTPIFNGQINLFFIGMLCYANFMVIPMNIPINIYPIMQFLSLTNGLFWECSSLGTQIRTWWDFCMCFEGLQEGAPSWFMTSLAKLYLEVSWVIGVPPVLIHFKSGFSLTNPSSYWGTPMTMETPIP